MINLISSYNSYNKLIKILNSLTKQETKYSKKIILLNDGSTDNTVEIANSFKDDR